MESQDRRSGLSRFLFSFVYASSGIIYGLRHERNLRIHFLVATMVLLAGFYFSISATEWLFVLSTISGMLSLELINSAVEKTVDLVTGQFHPLAKSAKDLSAGAVLIYACYSVIVGLLIFVPKIFS